MAPLRRLIAVLCQEAVVSTSLPGGLGESGTLQAAEDKSNRCSDDVYEYGSNIFASYAPSRRLDQASV